MLLASSKLRRALPGNALLNPGYSVHRDSCKNTQRSLRICELTHQKHGLSRAFSTSKPKLQKSDDWDKSVKFRNEKTRERIAERDFFLSVLNVSATKRDAKSYLSQFKSESSKLPTDGVQPHTSTEINQLSRKAQEAARSWPLHVALVKIRALQDLDDVTVEGLTETLSQLARLGLSSVIVLDCDSDDAQAQNDPNSSTAWRDLFVGQADRLVSALQKVSVIKARRLDSFLAVTLPEAETQDSNSASMTVDVQFSDVLQTTLRNGYIPVIPAIGYTTQSQRAVAVDSDQIVLALAREFIRLDQGVIPSTHQDEPINRKRAASNKRWTKIVVDRIILLDPLGGIPSATRGSHVFINMKQEYREVREELLSTPSDSTPMLLASVENAEGLKSISSSNLRHIKNLDLLQKALAILPPSSSALLATPHEAATVAEADIAPTPEFGVGTRRPKNPLIFNLLTDKPLVSSSLPVARLTSVSALTANAMLSPNPSTFLKLGLPLMMIPDPRYNKWKAPESSKLYIKLDEDPRIDFPRLLHLIEDSFNRPLDVEDYIRRIQNKLAGVIIAGDYDGGAILTWELPVGVPDDGSEQSQRRMVPYLDKFAVLKRSQGTGGVADVVFSAMVRSCFPSGVCWRSRKNNPVNKWYFERSVGTFKLPDSNWTMFWTTEGLVDDKQRFKDYESVCRKVMPSWADQK